MSPMMTQFDHDNARDAFNSRWYGAAKAYGQRRGQRLYTAHAGTRLTAGFIDGERHVEVIELKTHIVHSMNRDSLDTIIHRALEGY